jgi:hypothetical protein
MLDCTGRYCSKNVTWLSMLGTVARTVDRIARLNSIAHQSAETFEIVTLSRVYECAPNNTEFWIG